MINIFQKLKEFCKAYKKRIITVMTVSVLTIIIIIGSVGGVQYSRAKSNMKYNQEQLQKIALGKVPGEVLKVEKELNFEDAVFEYEFKIKDKDSMLQVVKLDSQYAVILGVNNENHMKENNGNHMKKNKDRQDKFNSKHGKD